LSLGIGCIQIAFDTPDFPHHHSPVRFSIVTPSLGGWPWLGLCAASIADQGGELEHVIQDGGSADGTQEGLARSSRVRLFIEKDRGMYDALNRGFQRAGGEILAWLNCDEQYLPGALARVGAYFDRHPEVDVVFGDVVVVDQAGEYLFHRKMQVPYKYHTWVCHLSTLSCATFFRRRVFFDGGFQFDTAWQAAGDGEWMLRLLKARLKMAALSCFTSSFMLTGKNLGATEKARRENEALRQTAPRWARACRPLIVAQHRLRRWLGGMYSQPPFTFEIYTLASPQGRQSRRAERPCFRPSPALQAAMRPLV
jgi:glycosyltransferase involved in cell wall biosynthesis